MKNNKMLTDIIIAIIIAFVFRIVISKIEMGLFTKYIIYSLVGLIYITITIYTDIKAYREGAYNPIIFGITEGYKNKFINIISRAIFYFSIFSIESLISMLIYIVICYFPIVLNVTILNLKCYPKIKIKKPILTNTIALDSIWIVSAIITCIIWKYF